MFSQLKNLATANLMQLRNSQSQKANLNIFSMSNLIPAQLMFVIIKISSSN